MKSDIGKLMARQFLKVRHVIRSHLRMGTDKKPNSFGIGTISHKVKEKA